MVVLGFGDVGCGSFCGVVFAILLFYFNGLYDKIVYKT